MVKFCKMCGTPLQEGVKFCPKCGATIGQAAFQQPPVQPQQPMYQPQTNTYQQPMAPQQPYYGQTQSYVPMPKKSNKKIFAAIIAVIIIVVLIIAIFFVFVIGNNKNDSSDESKIIGTWEIDSIYEMSDLYGKKDMPIPSGFKMIFKSNGDLTISPVGSPTLEGTWELKNGKLCIMSKDYGAPANCSDYSLSPDGSSLTITTPSTEETWDGQIYSVTSYTVLKKVTSSNGDDADDEEDNDVNDYTIEDILGSWEMAEDPSSGSSYDQIWTFYSNGSMKMDYIYTYSVYDGTNETSTYTTWANYELKNNQLCLNYTEYSFETCYDFEITNNGNTLTTTYYSITSTFTKIT